MTTSNYDKHVTELIVTTVQLVATVLFALVYCWGSIAVLVGETFLNFIILGKFTNFRCAWATSRVITQLPDSTTDSAGIIKGVEGVALATRCSALGTRHSPHGSAV